jgi:hypothetical protein
MLIDRLMPCYDAVRAEHRIVPGDIATVYTATRHADFIRAWRESTAVRLLFAARGVGERAVSLIASREHREPPPPESMRLGDMPTHGDWVLLGEDPPHEIAFGVVGRFWAGETIWAQIDAADFEGLGSWDPTLRRGQLLAIRSSPRARGRKSRVRRGPLGVKRDVVAPPVDEPPRPQLSSPERSHRPVAGSTPDGGRCERSATRSPSWSSTFAGSQLVPTPNWRGEGGHQVKQSACTIWIIGEPSRTIDRLADVRDRPVAPATHLVAEDPKSPGPPRADRADGGDAATGFVAVWNRRLLDHEASLRHAHLERGVVEITRRSMLEPRHHCFENATVETHEMATRSQRQPVQVDAGNGLRAAHGLKRSFRGM